MNETRAPTDDTVRQKVLADYKNGIKPKKLAENTGISINTIKSWISREKKKEAEKAAAKKSVPPMARRYQRFFFFINVCIKSLICSQI